MPQPPRALARCRLCWRITLAVFASILAVEAILLVPSYQRQERATLERLSAVGRAALIGAARGQPDGIGGVSPRLLERLDGTPLRGFAVYRQDGAPAGTVGETPALSLEQAQASRPNGRWAAGRERYELAWSPAETGLPAWVVARLDSSRLDDEMMQFVLRIAGLIVLISVFVCAVAMLILGRRVLGPLLTLRANLAEAMRSPANADLYTIPTDGGDELEETVEAVNSLLMRVSKTHREDLATMLAMVDHSADATLAYDGSGRLVYANQACLALCGYDDPREMDDSRVPRFRTEDGGDARRLDRLVATEGFTGEATLIGRDGGEVPCWLGAARLEDDTGSLIRYYATVTDITDLRTAQAQLEQQNVELAASNRAKSEFLANMSHELRTPLNAVIGFSEIMQNEMLGQLGNPNYKEYARDIHESGAHLLQMINDILDLAKIESGKLELDEQVCDLHAAIKTSVRLLRERARAHSIALVDQTPPDLPALTADERKVKQILINLLSNAVKFTPDGGRVSVTAEVGDRGLVFTISDSGIGIGAEDLERVFEPFRQVEGGITRRYEGTGLGLPLTRAMMELHGGTVRLESVVGEGTTAIVTFPSWRVVGGGVPDASPALAASL